MADEATNEAATAAEWPLRPWLLAGLLGLAGLLIHLVTGGNDEVPWQMAAAAFLFFGAIAAAFTLERDSWKEPSVFALAVGLVMAGLAWRAVRYGENLPDEQYGFAAGVVATALALPLFQAGFHRRRFATPYAEIYGHVWSDAISAAGALAFTGLSWLALVLMSELFHLLRIDFLRDLMDEGAFGWTFSGLAAGAALGTIRNQLKVLTVMQTVVLLVASLLAVPLAVGLVVFLLATAVQGPQMLWDTTRSATPLLLACAAGAFVLANAIARQSDEAMTRSRVMRVAGWMLAAVILPLALFAAVSMGLRLDQHGLSPERLWGLVAIVVAVACGLVYSFALIRGRKAGWADHLRKATFHFGLVVCALALLLALPILDFGAISARNQMARLESGKVHPNEFDFAALRWDFGEPGRRALRRLARSGNARVAELAQTVLEQEERVYPTHDRTIRTANDFDLRVQPEDDATRQAISAYLVDHPWECYSPCVALDLGTSDEKQRFALVQGIGVKHLVLDGGRIIDADAEAAAKAAVEAARVAAETADRVDKALPPSTPSRVEVRPYAGRQIYVDGRPVGEPFE